MRLLLDLGNTRLKWAALEDAKWIADGAVDWADDLSEAGDPWHALPIPTSVVAASVVSPAREERLNHHARTQGWPAPHWLRTPAVACGVRNAYAQPERLGVDRFLALINAHATTSGACVAIGVGTALTLDALTADGNHVGGLIAPGPLLMQRSLLEATAKVHPQQPGVFTECADNTADAVVSGCWGACAGLIERFVRQQSPCLGGAPQVLLGGGDAALLAPLLGFPSRVVTDAVLRGLAVWAAAHLPDDATY